MNFTTQQDVYEQKFGQKEKTKLLFLLDKFPNIPREFFSELCSLFESRFEEIEGYNHSWKRECERLEDKADDLQDEVDGIEIVNRQLVNIIDRLQGEVESLEKEQERLVSENVELKRKSVGV